MNLSLIHIFHMLDKAVARPFFRQSLAVGAGNNGGVRQHMDRRQGDVYKRQILLSVFICFTAGVDLYTLVGVSFTLPWLGMLLTGIVVSRGSNYTSDFIKRLQNPDIGEIVLEDIVEAADPANKATVHISGVPPNA